MKPVVDGLQAQYQGRVDMLVYGDVNNDQKANAFAAGKGVSAVPTMMLVSPDGKELERWVGTTSEEELVRAFEAAAGP